MYLQAYIMSVSVLCLLLVVAAVSANPGDPINTVCVAKHCAKSSLACTADKACRQNLECEAACFSKWDQDKTPEKFAVQNCSSVCTFSYASPAYTNFMTCVSVHKCMNLPALPNTCKGPKNITVLKEIPISELQGSWWVVRGHHPVYDCYPCQLNSFGPNNATTWIYSPDYQVFLANGSMGLIKQSGYVNITTTSQAGYHVVFDDAGIGNFENWWVIDKVPVSSSSGKYYYLIYYCGNVLQWNFEGAIVYSKTPELSEDDVPAVAASYKKATGLDFAKFCKVKAGTGCPDQPKIEQ